MLWIAVLLFGLFFLLSYPLTLRLRYQEGSFSWVWLPRLFGGYAKPRAFAIPANKAQPPEKSAKRLSLGPGAWYRIAQKTVSAVSIDRLKLNLTIGAADPCASSLLAGAFLAALGSLCGLIATAVRRFPARPEIRVRADWQGGGIQGTLDCIFHIHCGDIIRILFSVLIYAWKGRHTHGKRTRNRTPDENRNGQPAPNS